MGSCAVAEPRFISTTCLQGITAYSGKEISQAFDQYKPHLVVSVHPLLQNLPLDVMRKRVKAKLMDPTPFATVITDLTECHPTWYHPVRNFHRSQQEKETLKGGLRF
jgi:1,2-diacylglycerol 3-beta-galactosyltransferase